MAEEIYDVSVKVVSQKGYCALRSRCIFEKSSAPQLKLTKETNLKCFNYLSRLA